MSFNHTYLISLTVKLILCKSFHIKCSQYGKCFLVQQKIKTGNYFLLLQRGSEN